MNKSNKYDFCRPQDELVVFKNNESMLSIASKIVEVVEHFEIDNVKRKTNLLEISTYLEEYTKYRK